MKLPDYSEYLNRPDMLDWIESEWLRNEHIHNAQADFANTVITDLGIKSVIEIGCATGNLAKRITCEDYLGVDKNESCIKLAREKNPGKKFMVADIRSFKGKADLVCAFAILKHFSLEELPVIIKKLMGMGSYFIFDVPISEKTQDDGTEHNHVWLTVKDMEKMLGGKSILKSDYYNIVEPMYLV